MTTGPALYEPKIIIVDDLQSLSRRAAGFVVETLDPLAKPFVILPTGTTPLGMYKTLSEEQNGPRGLWNRLLAGQLDEYIGLEQGDDRLFSGWLSRVFMDKVGIPDQNRVFFRSNAADPAAEVDRIERLIDTKGGIDLAILGLGLNGHLGFNEPGSPLDAPTRVQDPLSPETIASNAAYWGGEDKVPSKAMTLGLGTLSRARSNLLLVSGEAKAGILDRALTGPVTPDVPASILRTHPNVTVIADRAALKYILA